MIKFSRIWAMPSPFTFSIKPIKELAERVLKGKKIIVDPFSANCSIANITNDLNKNSNAQYHMDAIEFLDMLLKNGYEGKVDAVLLDPPYSPRQVKECYDSIGIKVTQTDTQVSKLYKECKDRIARLLNNNGICITCGWNSNGLGKNRGFRIDEILLVPCGGGHNDYIITVENKVNKDLFEND